MNPFETGALAETVTVRELDYDEMAFDAAFKYKGFSFQGEAYVRRLSNFDATGPLPLDDVTDKGFMLQAMHMVVPRKLGLYVATGNIYDEFERDPWEVAGGASSLSVRQPVVAAQLPRHPGREVAGQLDVRLLHRRPVGLDLLAGDRHPAVVGRSRSLEHGRAGVLATPARRASPREASA